MENPEKFDYCELWYWFVCTGFVEVCNPRLLIISLTVFVFYGFVAISDIRLLIISLTVVVCASFMAVFDSRLLIISLIAFNGARGMVVLCDGCAGGAWLLQERRFCEDWFGEPTTGASTSMVFSHVERESWYTVSKSNALTTSVFSFVIKGSQFFEPTSS